MSHSTPDIQALFCEAIEKKSPEERRAYLDSACAGNADLRGQLEDLLDSHREARNFLGGSTPDELSPNIPLPTERPGTKIGPYKLLEKIGEGGMGEVYLAEQKEPVRRKVALKVIKPGMDTQQVVARFEAERQALAMMNHPNIARVLDAGTTDAGRPYFAMELVKGAPITEFCDHQKLNTRDRLHLFITVCQAFQHAHQKGLIHRDIKPSNVMVEVHDVTAVPKVIDFGVAKAIGQPLTDRTLHTEFRQMVGTPLYMSPEQAGQSSIDVDTRSDIYSLGVLLYEILTGQTPFESETLRKVGFDEMSRIIREVDPPRPSARISTLEARALSTVSDCRKIEPRKFSQQLRGDLDWIVMKALEKDRNRRYESASGFAADVQRYLDDEAVQACPPSAWYRFRKFARRNKAGLVIAGLILCFLTLLGSGVGWVVRDRQARHEELARDLEARQTKLNHEVELALQEASAARERGLTLTDNPYLWEAALVASSSALKRVEGLAAQHEAVLEPVVKERLRALAASLQADDNDRRFVASFDGIRLAQSQFNPAVRELNLEFAFPTLKEAFSVHYGIEIGATPVQQVVGFILQRPKAIQEHLLAALDVSLANVPTEEPQARPWLSEVLEAADVEPWRKKARQALAAEDWPALEKLAQEAIAAKLPPTLLSRLALEIPRELPTCLSLSRQIQRAHPDDFWANHNLARVLHYRERPQLDEAIRYYTAALALRQRNPGASVNLGNALKCKGELDGAITAYRDALQEHPDYAIAHEGLGLALEKKGCLDEAIAELRETIRLRNYVLDYIILGNMLAQKGLWDEAIAIYKQAIKLDPKHAKVHQWGRAYELGNVYNAWAWLLATAPDATARNPEEAVKLAKRALELGPQNAAYWNTLGVAQYRAGAWKEASLALQKSMELRNGGDAFDWFFIGMAHWQLGQKEEARMQYERALQWMKENLPQESELRRFRSEAEALLGINYKEP